MRTILKIRFRRGGGMWTATCRRCRQEGMDSHWTGPLRSVWALAGYHADTWHRGCYRRWTVAVALALVSVLGALLVVVL
jgi:hypothetical protein